MTTSAPDHHFDINIGAITCPVDPSRVSRNQDRFDKLVQLVQIDVGQDRRDHPTLRRAAERGVVSPVFQIPGPQHLPQQPQEPVVVDLLTEYPDHDLMVECSETIGDVTLDKPGCPPPRFHHRTECGVTTPAGPETV